MTVVAYDALLRRIRAEFLEMPGLCLTREQTQRLCGVDGQECQLVLDTLVRSKFLCVKANGVYARLSDGAELPRPHPVKADLGTGRRALKARA